MKKNISTMRFDEDAFDLIEHKKAADAVIREKARIKRVHRKVKYGKALLVVATVVVFFVLFFIAGEIGIFNMR
jgi:hypothetical protein